MDGEIPVDQEGEKNGRCYRHEAADASSNEGRERKDAGEHRTEVEHRRPHRFADAEAKAERKERDVEWRREAVDPLAANVPDESVALGEVGCEPKADVGVFDEPAEVRRDSLRKTANASQNQ